MTEPMYNERVFWKGMATSVAVVAVLTIITYTTGTVYAVPLAGVGGFTVHAEELTAESATVYPSVSGGSSPNSHSMLVVEQRNVTIDGMQLEKQIDVGFLPVVDGTARILITAEKPVTVDEQVIKFSQMRADTAVFDQQVIDEHHTRNGTQTFSIHTGDVATQPRTLENGRIVSLDNDGPAQKLTNTTFRAHYIASDSLSIPTTDIRIEYDH